MSEMGMKSGGGTYNTSQQQSPSRITDNNKNDGGNAQPKIQMIGQNIMNTPHVGIP